MATTQIINANFVIGLDRSSTMVGFALREHPELPWLVYQGDPEHRTFVGHVEPSIPEVLQRKLILAMVEVL